MHQRATQFFGNSTDVNSETIWVGKIFSFVSLKIFLYKYMKYLNILNSSLKKNEQ